MRPINLALIGTGLFVIGEWIGGRLWLVRLNLSELRTKLSTAKPVPWYARLLSGLGAGLMAVAMVLTIMRW
jgi:hypothetical protein